MKLPKINKIVIPHSRIVTPVTAGVLMCVVLCLGVILSSHQPVTLNTTPASKSTKVHVAAKKVSAPAAPAPAVVPAPVIPSKTVTTPIVIKKTTTAVVQPQPVVTPSPSSSVSGLTPTDPTTTTPGSGSSGSSGSGSSGSGSSGSSGSSTETTTSYSSTNWSGYLETGGNYTAISAEWTATSPSSNSTSDSADATWIGIGGVTTSDLIQVGTDNTVEPGGKVVSSAFYELLPASSINIPSLTVSPGDSMTAAIIEVSTGSWIITITDNTTGQTYTNTVAYASTNSSAEWIEEDPSYSFRRLVPFDDFGTANFSDASTTSNGAVDNLVTGSGEPITMVNELGQTEAAPSAIGSDDNSFSVTWSS